VLADPRLRERLTARWAQRLAPWIDLPAELPVEERARLAALRLLEDPTADVTADHGTTTRDRR
jgi:hypothetical protein